MAVTRERVEQRVMKRLDKVIDPHTYTSVVKMGMITGLDMVETERGFDVTVHFMPTSPHCPLVAELEAGMIKNASRARGVSGVSIEVEMPGEGDCSE